jgi:hypothetical protein
MQEVKLLIFRKENDLIRELDIKLEQGWTLQGSINHTNDTEDRYPSYIATLARTKKRSL